MQCINRVHCDDSNGVVFVGRSILKRARNCGMDSMKGTSARQKLSPANKVGGRCQIVNDWTDACILSWN